MRQLARMREVYPKLKELGWTDREINAFGRGVLHEVTLRHLEEQPEDADMIASLEEAQPIFEPLDYIPQE